MINEEIRKFEELTGKNANDFSIAYVGGYLDGYDKGKAEAPAQKLGCEICVNRNIKSKEACTSPFGVCEFFKEAADNE